MSRGTEDGSERNARRTFCYIRHSITCGGMFRGIIRRWLTVTLGHERRPPSPRFPATRKEIAERKFRDTETCGAPGWHRRRRREPSVSGAAVSIYRVARTHIFYLLRGLRFHVRAPAVAHRALAHWQERIFDQDDAGRLDLLSGGLITAVIRAALR